MSASPAAAITMPHARRAAASASVPPPWRNGVVVTEASAYERVTYRPEGASRSRTVILRDPLALVTKRTPLRWNLHYGELEDA